MALDLSTDDGLRAGLEAISRWNEPAVVPPVTDLPRLAGRPDRRPSVAHRGLAVAAALTLVVGVAALVATRPDPSPVAAAEGEWSPMAASPLSARQEPSALWSGSEVIIWGGWDGAGQALTDGARYDTRADRWAPMAPPPGPIGSVGPSAFAQGRAAYVVYPDIGEFDWRLITYDPAADAWATVIDADLTHLPSDRLVPEVPVPTPSPEALAVVDDRLVVVGWNSEAGSYEWNEIDVVAGTWPEAQLLPTSGDLYGAPKQVAVSGEQVIFGVDQVLDGATSAWGFRIDVPARTAEPIRPPTPASRAWHGQIGVSAGAFVRVGTITSGQGQSQRVAHRLKDDGTWEQVEPPSVGWAPDNHAGRLVTTPLGVLVLGGHDVDGSYGGLVSDGGTRLAAAPEVDQWKELPEPPVDLRRTRFAAVWTGTELIVWGGSLGALPIDGVVYGPGPAEVVGDGARFVTG